MFSTDDKLWPLMEKYLKGGDANGLAKGIAEILEDNKDEIIDAAVAA